ncbi:MAG: hypothetical protein PHP01_07770 [Phycisphaerae bacterium]|nr:hypothetical protein [Phycisphaerae bacterium]
MNWATRTKNKVHKDTDKVKAIIEMAWCPNAVTVSRIVGCSPTHVQRVRKQYKSTAHVFLSKESLRNMK